MTNRIYTNEKTCPLCHKNKAMFTLSLEGEKIQVCPTCYQIVKIESDRHKTKNIINDPKYTLDRIYQMLSDSVIEQNHAMQQIALTIYLQLDRKLKSDFIFCQKNHIYFVTVNMTKGEEYVKNSESFSHRC